MKKLLVLLASATACVAQALPIGPFATESWVDERIQTTTNGLAAVSYVDNAVSDVEDKIPDVSGLATKEYVDAVSNAIPDVSTFSTVEYVNTTSNNLALLMDDLVSEEELGSSVSNIVPAWALVPVPPITVEVDPAFTNWLATTNVVIDDNFGTFVSNVVPSWALVPIPPVTVEVDPAFTNWLATTNSATVQYVDGHQWDWDTQVTNHPSFATVADATLQMYRVYTEWAFTQEFEDAVEAIAEFDRILVLDDTSWMLYANNEDGSIHEAVGSFGYNDDGNPTAIYFYEPTEKYSDLYDEFNWKEVASRQAITGYCLGSQTNKLLQAAGDYADKEYVNSHQWDWYTQVTNAPSFVESEVDPAFTNWLATTNIVYSKEDGKWTSFGGYEIDPIFMLKYESDGSGNIETVGGVSLFNPTKAAVFVNEDDAGYLLHNIGRDITIDLRPASVLTLADYTEDADLSIAKRNLCTELGGSFIASSNANTTSYGVGKVTGNNLYEYLWPAKSGTIAIVEDLAGLASHQDVTNTVKAITNLADRIVSDSNEAYVNSSGVYYKHPDGYGLPATLSFNAAEDVQVGAETFPSNYTVVINFPEVTSSVASPIPIQGISTDGKWELSTVSGDASTGYIHYIGDGTSFQVFRITGFTGDSFSMVLDTAVSVDPYPNATLERSKTFATDELATQSFVYGLNSDNAKAIIDYENSVLRLSWGSGAYQTAYLPYYNDPSEFPQSSQGAITTNGNGSVNVARVSSNSVSGNDNFVFGNSNSVFGDNVTVFGTGNMVTNSNYAAVIGQIHTVKNSANSIVSGGSSNNLEDSPNSIITGVGGTGAVDSDGSFVLSGGGGGVYNSPHATFLAPTGTSVYDSQNIIIGGYHHNVVSNAPYSVVLGGLTAVTNQYVFIWNGGYGQYSDHGTRTFNVNPVGGIEGFWIGETNLATIIQNAGGGQPALSPDAIAPAWQQGSYTNGDFVIYNTHLYECTNMTSGVWTPADWKQTSVTEILGNLRKILDEINGEAL